jgi:hypothetical protein
MSIRTFAAIVATILLAACVSTESEKPPQSAGPVSGAAFEGMWCMQKPMEIAGWYGTVSMIVTNASDRGFSALYIWTDPSTHSGNMYARDKDGRFVMSGDAITYTFEKTLDRRGHIVGTGQNSRDNISWKAIFTRTTKTKMVGGVTQPDC